MISSPAVALHWNKLLSSSSSTSAACTVYCVPVAPSIKSVLSYGGVTKSVVSLYQEYVITFLPVATQDRVTDPPGSTVCESGCDVNLNVSRPKKEGILETDESFQNKTLYFSDGKLINAPELLFQE